MSLQRVIGASQEGAMHWIGPGCAKELPKEEKEAYSLAQQIMAHLCIQAPTKHQSGHPGGPLSSFTFAYFLNVRRNLAIDEPLRMSAGHLSLLAYGLEWLFGREGDDPRLQSPQVIIDTFRTPNGLPGHAEAGIGSIPFGAGPLGKGVSNGLGVALGLQYQKKPGVVDVLLADGDSQEGQVMEAFRLAPRLALSNLLVHGDWNDVQLSDLPSKTVIADFARIAAATGWNVIEVQNGNDPGQVLAALDLADTLRKEHGETERGIPTFLCYYTTMGHGVPLMEQGSNTGKENFHGTPLKEEVAAAALNELPSLEELVKKYEKHRKRNSDFRSQIAKPLPPPPKVARTITAGKGSARTDFGAVHIKNLMKVDPRIIVLHADLAGSGGFEKVAMALSEGGSTSLAPARVINVGVAEANMYMMAAGLRQSGLLPVTYTFAAFGTNEARANARLIDINCGHTRCAVLHDCTHAGISVGEDGETHQERHYLNIPFDHTQVWMPCDSNQAAAMAEKALEFIAEGTTSVYIFFPRSGHPQVLIDNGKPFFSENYVFEGKADLLRGRGDLTDQATIITTGIEVHEALAAADALQQEHHEQVRVLNVPCIRPLDATAIIRAALETAHLIVVEDHCSEGGLATQVADVIADFQLPCSLRRLGVNHYFPSGSDKDLRALAGLDAESIADAVLDEVHAEVCGGEDVLVTVLSTIKRSASLSRFGPSILPFIQELKGRGKYIEDLRTFWKKRACPPGKLPNAEALREGF